VKVRGLYLFPSLMQMDKAERATLTVLTVPALSPPLPPLVATEIASRPWCLLAEALKPAGHGQGNVDRQRCRRPARGVNATP
jgi:hypothetical protein